MLPFAALIFLFLTAFFFLLLALDTGCTASNQ